MHTLAFGSPSQAEQRKPKVHVNRRGSIDIAFGGNNVTRREPQPWVIDQKPLARSPSSFVKVAVPLENELTLEELEQHPHARSARKAAAAAAGKSSPNRFDLRSGTAYSRDMRTPPPPQQRAPRRATPRPAAAAAATLQPKPRPKPRLQPTPQPQPQHQRVATAAAARVPTVHVNRRGSIDIEYSAEEETKVEQQTPVPPAQQAHVVQTTPAPQAPSSTPAVMTPAAATVVDELSVLQREMFEWFLSMGSKKFPDFETPSEEMIRKRRSTAHATQLAMRATNIQDSVAALAGRGELPAPGALAAAVRTQTPTTYAASPRVCSEALGREATAHDFEQVTKAYFLSRTL